MKYFAVSKSVKIMKKVYIPCVSYKLSDKLKTIVEHLEKQGKAKICDRVMVFQNGKEITPARYIKKVSKKVSNSKVSTKSNKETT